MQTETKERKKLSPRAWLTLFVAAGYLLVLTLAGSIDMSLDRAATAMQQISATAETKASNDEADVELCVESQTAAKARTTAVTADYAAATAAKTEELRLAAEAKAAAQQAATAVAVQRPVYVQTVSSTNFSEIDAALSSNYRSSGASARKAWLYVPNTGINAVVVQSSDNNYFLRRTAYGAANQYGCFFFDYTCNVGSRSNMSRNLVIYGHSFKDKYWEIAVSNRRFAVLNMFRESLEFCRNNPYVFLYNGSETLVYQIFAVSVTNENLNYRSANLSDAVISTIRSLSYYNYNVSVSSSDKILTFSACLYNYRGTYLGYPNKYRMVIMSKLLPAGASLYATADVSTNYGQLNAFSTNYY